MQAMWARELPELTVKGTGKTSSAKDFLEIASRGEIDVSFPDRIKESKTYNSVDE